ncbi:MAG: 4Fe-4S dicluster domain-containing protein [Chloroflexi bacterium]|nr:4Fe-4S dicluster domain-containing protein [Chloroflexota bacterium]
MSRLGMVIDLKTCIACYACVVSCKVENGTPPTVFWAKVLEREEGKYPTARRIILPVLCNHCQDPPCLRVCPSGATTKREDGIVLVDAKKCVGCKACMTACPYDSRYFIKEIRGYFGEDLVPCERVSYQKHQEGVVEKCTFCVERVKKGLEPACVQVCPASCRHFGDLDDPNSEVSRLLKARLSFQLLPEIGTKPSVYYLT